MSPSGFRVIHGPTNIGNQPYVLSRCERQLGCSSDLVVNYDTWLQYPADRVLGPHGRKRPIDVVRRAAHALRAPLVYDAMHMYFGRSTTCWDDWGPRNRWWFRDIALARRLGRTTVMTLQGCDIRQSDISSRTHDVTMCEIGRCSAAPTCRASLDDARREFATESLPLFDRVFVLNPDLTRFVPNSEFLPYANVEIDALQPTEPVPTGPIRIVHAPSDEGIKGSVYVYEAIDRLSSDFDIDFITVKGMPHADALKVYQSADLIIDQVLAGWYGGLAVEAMALGKPVAAYLRETDLDVLPAGMRRDLPIVRISPSTITDDLAAVLGDRQALIDRGRASRSFVERWHNPMGIARQLVKVYQDPTAPLQLGSSGTGTR